MTGKRKSAEDKRPKERTPFGERLHAARRYAGLSQQVLANAVDMSQSALAEAEKTGQTTGKTVQIAAACKVNSNWLATGEGQMELADTSLSGAAHSPSSASATLTTGVTSIASGRLAMDLTTAMQVIAYAANSVDATARAYALDLIKLVVSNPEAHAEGQIPLIVKHLSGELAAEQPKRKSQSGRA
jgi:DNA-binding XRE family transcriptional regulator